MQRRGRSSASARARANPSPSIVTITPGLVQNWPAPSTTESASTLTTDSARSPSAPGSTNTGLVEPISAYTGIGSTRRAAASNSARPAVNEPVNATARVAGCSTSATPTPTSPATCWKHAAGRPARSTARAIASAAIAAVVGCAGWALTTTGQAAASADAVSPPGVAKAKGKFDAPNTTTGPIGHIMRRRPGAAVSIVARAHVPSATIPANASSCVVVRVSSLRRRAGPRCDSWSAAAIRSAARRSNSSAAPRSRATRAAGGRRAPSRCAAAAASIDASTSPSLRWVIVASFGPVEFCSWRPTGERRRALLLIAAAGRSEAVGDAGELSAPTVVQGGGAIDDGDGDAVAADVGERPLEPGAGVRATGEHARLDPGGRVPRRPERGGRVGAEGVRPRRGVEVFARRHGVVEVEGEQGVEGDPPDDVVPSNRSGDGTSPRVIPIHRSRAEGSPIIPNTVAAA